MAARHRIAGSGATGIDGGLEDDEGAPLQVSPNCFASRKEGTEIRLARCIHRCGNGYDDKVGTGKVAGICRAVEQVGGLHIVATDFTSGILVAAVGFDLDFRQVVTDRPKSLTEFNGQGQADIAQADHGNGAVFSGSHGQSVLPVT
jgi:hypothetical protein